MKIKLQLGIAAAMCAIVLAPAANAQSIRWEQDRRQDTKNEWRNIAIASGLLGVLGLLKEDKTLTFVGAAGALYSAYRYEQDRKSQNRLNRARYTYFSQPYFYRDGRRYDRQTVYRNGQQYYQFVCRDNDRNNGWNDRDTRWDDRDDRWDDRDDRRDDHRGCARHSSWNSRCDDCRDHDRRSGSNGNWGNGHNSNNGGWNDRRDDDRWDDRRNNSNGNWNNGRGSDKWNDKHRSSMGGKSKSKGKSKNGKRN